MEKDFLIVGQGLAGTVLAYLLTKAGKRVMVVDNAHKQAASKIAAGLYNPVVFRRLGKTWKADALIPFAEQFYQIFQQELGVEILSSNEIVRLFSSIEEQNNWMAKSASESFNHFITDKEYEGVKTNGLYNEHGHGVVTGAGRVRIGRMVKKYREQLNKQMQLAEEPFEFDALELEEDSAIYKGMKVKKVVFCEGAQAAKNPYFNWLPWNLAKGEVLKVRMPNLELNKVINKGFFILPLEDDEYKIGSTFSWKDLSNKPTEAAKEELLQKLRGVIDVPVEVLKQQAGVRPTVSDRRPYLGLHPKHPALAIFNGLGTKGVILAPYFANQMMDFLVSGTKIDDEVNINRHLDRFNQ